MLNLRASTTLWAVICLVPLTGCIRTSPGTVCGTIRNPDYAMSGVGIAGPSTITDGAIGTYTVTYSIQRESGFTAAVTPIVTVKDADDFLRFGDDLLGWGLGTPVSDEAGFANFTLSCVNNKVRGTATTTPGGDPNNPNSGERNAEVYGRVNERCSEVLTVRCE